jgi:hypothetical protein
LAAVVSGQSDLEDASVRLEDHRFPVVGVLPARDGISTERRGLVPGFDLSEESLSDRAQLEV